MLQADMSAFPCLPTTSWEPREGLHLVEVAAAVFRTPRCTRGQDELPLGNS